MADVDEILGSMKADHVAARAKAERLKAGYLARARARARAAQGAREAQWLAPPAPRPGSHPYGVSHAGAETLFRDWLMHLADLDGELTATSGDGGVDVLSKRFAVGMKNYTGAVGVKLV